MLGDLRAPLFQIPRILFPQILTAVVLVKMARNIPYVLGAVISYEPFEATTAAADMNCAGVC